MKLSSTLELLSPFPSIQFSIPFRPLIFSSPWTFEGCGNYECKNWFSAWGARPQLICKLERKDVKVARNSISSKWFRFNNRLTFQNQSSAKTFSPRTGYAEQKPQKPQKLIPQFDKQNLATSEGLFDFRLWEILQRIASAIYANEVDLSRLAIIFFYFLSKRQKVFVL